MAASLQDLLKFLQPDLDALPDLPQAAIASEPAELTGPHDNKLRQARASDADVKPLQSRDTEPKAPPNTPVSRLRTLTSSSLDKTSPLLASILSEPELVPETRFTWVTGPKHLEETLPTEAGRALRQPSSEVQPTLSLAPGEPGPAQLSYCPILPVSKFPYKYIHGAESQPVAESFFDQGKFWVRHWQIFYVQHPDTLEVLLLVPEYQVNQLLKEINEAFELDLKITNAHRNIGLAAKYPAFDETLPHFLGESISSNDYERLKEMASNEIPGPAISSDARASAEDLAAFKAMIEDGIQLNKAKNKAKKEEQRARTVLRNTMLGQELKRAQRYLGLRPKKSSDDPAWIGDLADVPGVKLPIDVNSPAPWPFEHQVVFICIDGEAWEQSPGVVTEMGIATLDTADLVGIAPGAGGANWFAKIRARHLRVQEYSHLRNSQWVESCPDRFEFGTSEFVLLEQAGAAIKAAFNPPYSGNPATNRTTRNVIVLGHDLKHDIEYCAHLGWNPLDLPSQKTMPDGKIIPGLVETLDTATLWRTYKHEQNPTGLGKILAQLDILGWSLHNGGNDAVYAIQAMLAIAVKEAKERGEIHKENKTLKREVELQAKVKERAKEIEEDMRAGMEGWSGDEADDGGIAVAMQGLHLYGPR